MTSPLAFARIRKRWTRRSSGNISRPSVRVSLLPGLRQASAKACSLPHRQAAKSAERAKGPCSGPSSYPRSPGPKGAGRRPLLASEILFTAHISLLQERHSCDLASSQLPTMGGGLHPACSFLKFLFWACACPSAFPWLRGSGPRPRG